MTTIYLTPVDHDALRRALAEARRERNPALQAQLDRKERDHGLLQAQLTAARHCQRKNLKLRLWESPPIYGDLVVEGLDPFLRRRARELLGKLSARGLSRYEPNPEAALQAPPAA